jgi:subtilase family serine protease
MEPLESRRLLSAVANAALNPAGLTPQQVRNAYGFNEIQFTNSKGKAVLGDGAGQTIAVVVAYRDPGIAKDLRLFDAQFGLPNQASKGQFALTIATPKGRPATNADWAQETALDVEWAHAIAPAARIVLVEMKSDSPQDLFAGVDYARNRRGVTVVSMSWGWDNTPADVEYQNYLSTPVNHVGGLGKGDGVTFVEAGSDDGAPTAFPDASINVVSVGGTTLTLNGSDYIGETALPASASSDTVAYDADPNTGFAVYDSMPDSGVQGWQIAGGTSAGAPQWAGLFAIADQGRALAGKHSLDNAAQTLPILNALPATDFHVITGADAGTGRGSPFADQVIAGLVAGD